MRSFKTILVTGGSGFIGSNFIRYLLGREDFQGRVVNLDALTYAGNPENLADIEASLGGSRYFFEKADIRDLAAVQAAFERHKPDAIVHFAAESHVDRSILGPADFVTTNLMGTFNLLEAARAAWKDRSDVLFHHVSTDEVFGSLGEGGSFSEETPYDPRSPYSASKAGSDQLVRAYGHTYGLPATISNCSNNYGPYQFPEKLVPLMILNMLEGKSLPVYGDGKQVRDWIHVEDHNAAVWLVMREGRAGRTYCIGGENEWENVRLLGRLIELVAEEAGLDPEKLRSLVTHVKDRPGHDRRYAIDCSRLKSELGWERAMSFDEGLRSTVRWYLGHRDWCERVRSGEYRSWMDKNYARR
ncbi:MAG TPA: dTDP-glucose 4,6-dehydratase [Spirochaetales bacterium]|nr:dTDP-glucose 4,6-dehydratase [Spirochaetales bacterium]HRY53098.1 dTDP-glucose 4,6-dehydratase [Spirochaetia bacterium]HRZ66221.1 dTDP-glucose 4,6-dehydratase [Spirochaetia bacterium]